MDGQMNKRIDRLDRDQETDIMMHREMDEQTNRWTGG
jgi:hypothetical protein